MVDLSQVSGACIEVLTVYIVITRRDRGLPPVSSLFPVSLLLSPFVRVPFYNGLRWASMYRLFVPDSPERKLRRMTRHAALSLPVKAGRAVDKTIARLYDYVESRYCPQGSYTIHMSRNPILELYLLCLFKNKQ